VIHDEDPSRSVAIGGAKRADIEAVGATVDSMRAAVTGALVQLVGLYYLDDLRLRGIRLGIDNVDA
jgi:hypothetical protein